MTDWQKNTGRLPRGASGKRVYVELFNGKRPVESWAADGRGGCNWTISEPPFPFEIRRYRID